jgi:ribosomal-protein-alanine N-acetyltransferase
MHLKYSIVPMEVRHVPAVAAIEHQSFPTAWPPSAYRREIERNQMAYYVVAKRLEDAVPPRRDRRFPIVDEEDTEQHDGLLRRLARLVRGEARAFSQEDAAELETIVGYTGMWLMVDDAHITTIAVDPPFRGEGIGDLLLIALIDRACYLGAETVTLECRVSNTLAQRLYRKYLFHDAGIRKRYYSDDGEDALIMTTERLDSPLFQQTLAANRDQLHERLRAD